MDEEINTRDSKKNSLKSLDKNQPKQVINSFGNKNKQSIQSKQPNSSQSKQTSSKYSPKSYPKDGILSNIDTPNLQANVKNCNSPIKANTNESDFIVDSQNFNISFSKEYEKKEEENKIYQLKIKELEEKLKLYEKNNQNLPVNVQIDNKRLIEEKEKMEINLNNLNEEIKKIINTKERIISLRKNLNKLSNVNMEINIENNNEVNCKKRNIINSNNNNNLLENFNSFQGNNEDYNTGVFKSRGSNFNTIENDEALSKENEKLKIINADLEKENKLLQMQNNDYKNLISEYEENKIKYENQIKELNDTIKKMSVKK